MNPSLVLNTLWKYIGPGQGKDRTHRIISIEGDELITTTHLDSVGTSYSWLGDIDDFLEQFVKLP